MDMDGLDLEGFVSSQKAKLVEEKSRLEKNERYLLFPNVAHHYEPGSQMPHRKASNILPSDSIIVERADKLRKERQSEYLEYVRKKEEEKARKHGPAAPPVSRPPVAEIRKNMSHDREEEINRNKKKLDIAEIGSQQQQWWQQQQHHDYAALRDKKIAEEKRYRRQMLAEPSVIKGPRKPFEEEEDQLHLKFDKHNSNWDREESKLLEWTRNQAHGSKNRPSRGNRLHTPPASVSGEDRYRAATIRSISAPSVAGGGVEVVGIAGLGSREEDAHVKRLKQLKYGEELRNQMQEKRQGARFHHCGSSAWGEEASSHYEREMYRDRQEHGELTLTRPSDIIVYYNNSLFPPFS